MEVIDKPKCFAIIQNTLAILIRRKEAETIDICFYEPDETMAERLLDYWMSHGLAKYDVAYYSDEKLLRENFLAGKAKLWILDEQIREHLPEQSARNILWLSDNPEALESVFKFRSAALLLETILHYVEVGAGEASRDSRTQIVSFYSPVRRSMQTSFGIVTSHILSQKGRILYLNLEGYSGFSELLTGYYSKDISDFIYSIYHSKEKFPFNTTNFIYRVGDVDMIPPVLNPMNLQEISGGMWQDVLVTLLESNRYDYIVIDISDFVQGAFEILKMSQIILAVSKGDVLAERKWQQFQMLLEGLHEEAILQKMHKVILPPGMQAITSLETYMPGAFTDFVENSLREVGLL